MVRKIRVSFLVALAAYLLIYFGIWNYVNSTVNLDPDPKCIGDLSCAQANFARTLAADATLYSLIAAVALGGLAFVVVPAGKRKAISGQRTAAPTVQRPIQNEIQAAKKAAQPTVVHKGRKCSRCGTDNPAANKFCVECGQSMVPPPPAKQQCTRCGTDNLAVNKFCVECGQPMAATSSAKKQCAHCGAINEPAYSFCTDCGTSLTVPQVEAESQGSSPSAVADTMSG